MSDNGNAPATKEDIRNLELTMLAGFQLCMEELKAINALIARIQTPVSREALEEVVIAQRACFAQQMENAREQVLAVQIRGKSD